MKLFKLNFVLRCESFQSHAPLARRNRSCKMSFLATTVLTAYILRVVSDEVRLTIRTPWLNSAFNKSNAVPVSSSIGIDNHTARA